MGPGSRARHRRGRLLGNAVGGPPGFIVYRLTTLVTVGIPFYDANALVAWWVGRVDGRVES